MFLTIDKNVCERDGHCVAVCPAQLIEMGADAPTAIDGAETICIRCGHCVSVCPTGALQLPFLKPEECVAFDAVLQLKDKELEQLFRGRRSIRAYRKEAVDKALLERVLNLASAAPTAMNRQPVRWIVVHEKEAVRSVTELVIEWMRYSVEHEPEVAAGYNMNFLIQAWESGVDRICRDAPHLVFAITDKTILSGKTDCDIALSYLELALFSFGLGSCWAGYVMRAVNQWLNLRTFLGVGDESQVHGGIMCGYPRVVYKRIPPRNNAAIKYI